MGSCLHGFPFIAGPLEEYTPIPSVLASVWRRVSLVVSKYAKVGEVVSTFLASTIKLHHVVVPIEILFK